MIPAPIQLARLALARVISSFTVFDHLRPNAQRVFFEAERDWDKVLQRIVRRFLVVIGLIP